MSTPGTATTTTTQQQTTHFHRTSPISPISVSDWEIPRWNELQQKRVRLKEQRASLEQRLFAYCDPNTTSTIDQQKVVVVVEYEFRHSKRITATWTGPLHVQDQLPHGVGRIVYSNGQVYEGHVQCGKRHGRGTNTWPDGQVYSGEWQEDSRTGRGTHTWPDGRCVTGCWRSGHLQGRVFFQWPNGSTYDGD